VCLSWQGAPAHHNPTLLLELWNQTLSDDDSSVYLAYQKEAQNEVGEVVVGFVHVTYQARPARLGWRATLEELHTTGSEPEEIARALLAAVVGECRRRCDVIALYLLTQPDLEPHYSESMYAELGFVPRGRDVLIWQGQLLE
jgi:GNAT superfamily N-acetyltransferase